MSGKGKFDNGRWDDETQSYVGGPGESSAGGPFDPPYATAPAAPFNPPTYASKPDLFPAALKAEKPEDEIVRLEAEIVVLKARILAINNPFQEYPKMVKGLTVQTPEEEAKVLGNTAKIDEVASANGPIRTIKA